MAKNHLLTYLSALNTAGDNIAADADNALYENDNGEAISVKEARPQALEAVDQAIRQLQELRTDIEKLPMKQFEVKHELAGQDHSEW